MRAGTVLFGTLALLLLFGCRGAPDPTERSTEVQTQSGDYAEIGAEYAAAGDLQRAELFLNRALSGFRSIDDRHGAAYVQLELARVYTQSGLLDAAESNLETAERTAEAIEAVALRVEARALRAEIALNRNEPEPALDYLTEAEALVADVPESEEQAQLEAVILHNIGVAYARLERFEEARSALEEALALNEGRETLSEMASNHYMLASVASRSGAYDRALDHAQQALSIDKETENSSRIAGDLEALGSISREAGELEAAEDYLTRAYGVYEALGAQEDMLRLLRERAALAEQRGDGQEVQELQSRIQALEQGSADGRDTS